MRGVLLLGIWDLIKGYIYMDFGTRMPVEAFGILDYKRASERACMEQTQGGLSALWITFLVPHFLKLDDTCPIARLKF